MAKNVGLRCANPTYTTIRTQPAQFAGSLHPTCYYFLPVFFCANALPAADFDALLVLASLRVFEAAVAALEDVCFAGAFVWDNALAAAVLDFVAVALLVKVFEALLAAFLPVTLLFITFALLLVMTL
jgi:hypothetical protein